MPLYKTLSLNNSTTLLIWKVSETEEELSKGLTLSSFDKDKLKKLKRKEHRKSFWAVRQLLKHLKITENDFYYTSKGKPILCNNKHLSISHTKNYVAVIVSDRPIGVDVEHQSDKLNLVANKYLNMEENMYLSSTQNILASLSVIWGVKEAVFKIYGGLIPLSFKNDIQVYPFTWKKQGQTQVKVCVDASSEVIYPVLFFEVALGVTCVVVGESLFKNS